jgi:Calcineurin-like phosphoesterase
VRPEKTSLACTVVVGVLLAMDTATEALQGPCMAFAQTPTARACHAAGARVKTGNRDDGEPLFRFLQIADTHVYEGPPHCALANKKMKWVVETVGSGKHFPVPDFVIHSGDMIDGEPQSAGVRLLEPDLRLFREMIQPLRCPFHPCVGNHENQQQEGDAAAATNVNLRSL